MNNKFLKEIEFDNEYINLCLSKIDKKLKEYIETKILPEYDLNDKGHNQDHINFVLKRAFEISKNYDINYNILYTSVSFHDIACHINRELHEKLSAEVAFNDIFLNEFFCNEEMNIIKEAIEDHRASSKNIPRNIYGKILSSADRKVSIKEYFIASLFFGVEDFNSLDKNKIIEDSYNFAIKKFGKQGYATNKFYVEDKKYKDFIENLQYLIEHKEEYFNLAEIIFNEVKDNN